MFMPNRCASVPQGEDPVHGTNLPTTSCVAQQRLEFFNRAAAEGAGFPASAISIMDSDRLGHLSVRLAEG